MKSYVSKLYYFQISLPRSTIPSADVLANPRPQPLRKLLWCAVLTPLIYFTVSDLRDVINGYLKFPVSIHQNK